MVSQDTAFQSPRASELHPPTQEKVSPSVAECKNIEAGLQRVVHSF